MRHMPLCFTCRAALALVLAATAGTLVEGQDAARGAALAEQARQALGGSRVEALNTLQVTGTFRRVIGNNDTEGDFEIVLEPPDKYVRSEKTGTPGQPSTETIEALVGTEVRDEVRGGDGPRPSDDDGPVAGGMPGRGRMMVVRDPETRRRARQADVARLTWMWLLRSDAPVSWVGIAESPDGKADVLEARFADGVPTRLFLDAESHLPLMMTWQGPAGRLGGPGGRRGMPQRGRVSAQPVLPPPPADLRMTFSEYRDVDGIRLPHRITRAVDGMTVEEWNVRRYRVNPTFEAETFTR